MKISPLLRILPAAACRLLSTVVIAACLVVSAPAWGATDEPAASPAPEVSGAAGIAEARALIRQGRFAGALGVLRPLAGNRGVDTNVLFLIGLAAIGESQRPSVAEADRDALLDEAIASLRTMLVDRPDLVRVRLELARAFFLKGEDSLSRRHFERVLAGNPPAAVAANVRRFLSEIRARRRWSMYLGGSVGAGHQHRRGVGGADHLHSRLSLPPRRGGADDLGRGGLGVDGRGVSVPPG